MVSVTRKQLIREIADRMNIALDATKDFVETYEAVIYDTLNSGEEVKLRNFLHMYIHTKKGSARFNVVAQEKVWYPTKYILKIRPLGELKNSIENQPVSKFDLQGGANDGESTEE